jgi:hypothetical protein
MTAPKRTSKPKKQEDRSILINFVLDKSGSMQVIRDATISGFNEFLGDQQREGGSAVITLTLFDTQFATVASAMPIAHLAPLTHQTYEPDGMTALYDAIAHTMKITDDYVAAHKPDQVLFVIMTDGEENSSREYTREQIFKMIGEHQTKHDYEFIYLGANQDAYAVSRAMGIREGRSLHYDHSPDAARETMTRVSHNVRAHRRSDLAMQADTAFFSDQFEAAGAIPYDEHKAREAAKAKPANQKDAK